MDGLTESAKGRGSVWLGWRYVVYTVVILGFTASLPLIARRDEGLHSFRDGGVVEWVQVVMLGVIGGVLIAAGVRTRAFREVFVLLASAALFAAVRELDYLLDVLVPLIGWKIGYAIPIAAFGFALRGWDAFEAQMHFFLHTGAFVTLWAGLMIAIPIGQLVGHGELLGLLMGDDYDHHYKHAIEEMLETTGYIVLGMGSVESVLALRDAALRDAV